MSDLGRSELHGQVSEVEYNLFREFFYLVSLLLFKISIEIFLLLKITANIKLSNIV